MRMVPAHSGGFGFLKATVKASLTSLPKPDPAPAFEIDCQANRLGSAHKTHVMMMICRPWFAGLAVRVQSHHNLQTVIRSCVLPADAPIGLAVSVATTSMSTVHMRQSAPKGFSWRY